MTSSFPLLKLYRVLVSMAGIIGMTIGFGIALYTCVNRFVITNDEYLASNNASWRFEQCKQPGQQTEDCEQKAKISALTQRGLEVKETLISSSVRGLVFLILFVTHYPALAKESHIS